MWQLFRAHDTSCYSNFIKLPTGSLNCDIVTYSPLRRIFDSFFGVRIRICLEPFLSNQSNPWVYSWNVYNRTSTSTVKSLPGQQSGNLHSNISEVAILWGRTAVAFSEILILIYTVEFFVTCVRVGIRYVTINLLKYSNDSVWPIHSILRVGYCRQFLVLRVPRRSC